MSAPGATKRNAAHNGTRDICARLDAGDKRNEHRHARSED